MGKWKQVLAGTRKNWGKPLENGESIFRVAKNWKSILFLQKTGMKLFWSLMVQQLHVYTEKVNFKIHDEPTISGYWLAGRGSWGIRVSRSTVCKAGVLLNHHDHSIT